MFQTTSHRIRLNSFSFASGFAPRRPARLPGIAVLVPALALFTACAGEFHELGELEQKAISQNGIKFNGLNFNGLNFNGMSMNAITQNALSQDTTQTGGSQPLNTANIDLTSELARSLVKYSVGCALNEGDILFATVDGVYYEFPGNLGVAPAWRDRALNSDEAEAVSACLLAHVNYYQVPVAISVRDLISTLAPGEETDFSWYEASFFGNLFNNPQQKYVCVGDPAPDFTQVDPANAGDRYLRRCSDVEVAGSNVTMCEFTFVGACADVCTFAADGSIVSCAANGQNFQRVASVWLADDTEYITN